MIDIIDIFQEYLCLRHPHGLLIGIFFASLAIVRVRLLLRGLRPLPFQLRIHLLHGGLSHVMQIISYLNIIVSWVTGGELLLIT